VNNSQYYRPRILAPLYDCLSLEPSSVINSVPLTPLILTHIDDSALKKWNNPTLYGIRVLYRQTEKMMAIISYFYCQKMTKIYLKNVDYIQDHEEIDG